MRKGVLLDGVCVSSGDTAAGVNVVAEGVVGQRLEGLRFTKIGVATGHNIPLDQLSRWTTSGPLDKKGRILEDPRPFNESIGRNQCNLSLIMAMPCSIWISPTRCLPLLSNHRSSLLCATELSSRSVVALGKRLPESMRPLALVSSRKLEVVMV